MLALSPETHLFLLNAGLLGVAYFGVYPGLRVKTLGRIATIDAAVTAMAVSLAGAWYWGSDVVFNLLIFQTNWLIFTLVTLFVLEIPLVVWFLRKYGSDWRDDDS